MSYDVEIAKQRIGRVFRYLAEMHRVRTPPIVCLEEREWVLPLDGLPCSTHIQTDYSFGRSGDPQAEDDPRDGCILKVGRPRESECPEPSVVIKNWLKPGWDRVDADPNAIVKRTLKGQAFSDSRSKRERSSNRSENMLSASTTLRSLNPHSRLRSIHFSKASTRCSESEKA